MHKVRKAMKSSGNNPMRGNVQVDEFVVVGKETSKPGRSYDSKKKKSICAVELTDDGKVKRFYTLKTEDFSARSLRLLFDKHIDKQSKVTTDLWKSYSPIAMQYNITQIPSENGMNFMALHTMIHQLKSWIRTTYSCASKNNLE